MRKKLIITLIIMIIMIQAIMPIMVYADNSKGENSFFDSDITFRWESFKNNDNGLVDYGLCIPSNANEYEKIPLIVWLHGKLDVRTVDRISTYTTGLPYTVLTNNELNGNALNGFSAYILCPLFPGTDMDNRIMGL